jgi:ABC-type Fe3+ transport system substrate-binding protein
LLLDWMTSKRGGKVIAESGAYPANPGGGTPRSDLVAYPAPEKIWNMRADKWADRDTRMPQWREIFGVK